MLTTALLLMFASADAPPTFLLADSPRAVRLIANELVPPPSDLPSYAGWSKAQLKQEYDRLRAERPGIGLPIGLLAGGGGALVLGLYIAFFGALASTGGASALPFLVTFGVIGTAGAAMMILGGIVLSRILPDRRVYGRQMDEVERLMKEGGDDEEERQYQVPPPPPAPLQGPPPEGPPPPPLPPPYPQASLTFPLFFARF